MKTCTSVSGGQTSAYLAANYPTDYNVFALVRIEDMACRYPDEVLRKRVEDRIGADFIATAEDDKIIRTLFELEQYIGREIKWVTGPTFEQSIASSCGYLPNVTKRYCTTKMKLEPIFKWWQSLAIDPIIMQIGFRANESKRSIKMKRRQNAEGLIEHKTVIGNLPDGRNKWGKIAWQRPIFPLIRGGILKDTIVNYWRGKPVTFAPYNNCVGCFHRNPPFLKLMFNEHPEKMNWFASQEGGENGYWKSVNGEVIPYTRIRRMLSQIDLDYSDFTSCDAGYCEPL